MLEMENLILTQSEQGPTVEWESMTSGQTPESLQTTREFKDYSHVEVSPVIIKASALVIAVACAAAVLKR
jgi:hypothetical protein